jgi:hypothetical protein
MRALVLARGVRARWPKARIEFVTSHRPAALRDDGFACHVVEEETSKNAEAVRDLLRRLVPIVAVFDNRGRTETLACAARLGIKTVFIASQTESLERLFRSRRPRYLDQLWLVQRRFGTTPASLGWRRRLQLALLRGPEVHTFDSILPETDPARSRELRGKLGVDDAPYVLFVAGGGGYVQEARPVADVFVEAARRVSEVLAIPCIAVLGPLHPGPVPALPGVIVVESLGPEAMIDLLSEARVVACGGGGIAGQALASGLPCVVAPAGGPDQDERIQACAEAGLIEPSPLEAGAIAAAVQALLADAERQISLRNRIASCGFRNGLHGAVDQLGRLAGAARRAAP